MEKVKFKNIDSTKKKGIYGEKLLKEYLESRGYVYLAKNLYISRYAEIDLVFHNPKRLNSVICIEVKTQYISHGKQAEQGNVHEYWTKRDRISKTKIRKLVQLANNPDWVLRAIHSRTSHDTEHAYRSLAITASTPTHLERINEHITSIVESIDGAECVYFCIAFVYIDKISGALHKVDFARLEDIIDY